MSLFPLLHFPPPPPQYRADIFTCAFSSPTIFTVAFSTPAFSPPGHVTRDASRCESSFGNFGLRNMGQTEQPFTSDLSRTRLVARGVYHPSALWSKFPIPLTHPLTFLSLPPSIYPYLHFLLHLPIPISTLPPFSLPFSFSEIQPGGLVERCERGLGRNPSRN